MLDQGRCGVRRRLPDRGHPGRLPDDLDAGTETKGPAKLAMFAVRPLLNMGFHRFLTNLRRYTDKRFAATGRD
jgi:hypothetical protein